MDSNKCLFERSDKLSAWIRWGVPLLFLCNAALFICANVLTNASVILKLSLLDKHSFKTGSIYDVSVSTTVYDAWKAEAYFLAFMIAFFSGFWPQLKIVITLACWFLPVTSLASRRGFLLFWSYAMTKWSLVEVFILILIMVSFHVDAFIPDYPGTRVNSYVVPQTGLYLFIAAIFLSTVLSRVALQCHRRCTPPPQSPSNGKATSQLFCLSRQSWYELSYLYLLVITAVLLACGLCVKSFRLVFDALAGWALTYIAHQDPTIEESAISLGMAVANSLEQPHAPPALFMQAVYLTSAVVVPSLSIVAFFLVTSFPQMAGTGLLTLCEVLFAWSGADVFWASTLAATLEMKYLVVVVLEGRCDSINILLKKYFDQMLDGHDECLAVETSLLGGGWYLLAYFILFIITGSLFFWTFNKHHSPLRPSTSNTSASSSLSPSPTWWPIDIDMEQGDHGWDHLCESLVTPGDTSLLVESDGSCSRPDGT